MNGRAPVKSLVVPALLGFALGASCGLRSNPDVGRYSCTVDADCGAGFTCRAQASGGALCFRPEECAATETCNGVDDDCDGRIDSTFPEQGMACSTGRAGRCGPGTTTCVAGSLACQAVASEQAELCNGADDNCDGRADETFDLTQDSANCGACGTRCPAGTGCRDSRCQESACADGLDNDSNGKRDCEETSCFQRECSTAAQPASRCGVRLGEPPVEPDAGLSDAGSDGGVDGGIDGGIDAGPDAGGADAAVADAGSPDAGADDGGSADAGVLDAGGSDDAGLDAGGADAGLADAGSVDASVVDAGAVDAGAVDAGSFDAGPVDAGSLDAGSLDAGLADAGARDAGAVMGCFPPETACANGFDDDGDGLADCADGDCDTRACGAGRTCSARQCR